eukprot:752335-Hanusia_phi.AAC.4
MILSPRPHHDTSSLTSCSICSHRPAPGAWSAITTVTLVTDGSMRYVAVALVALLVCHAGWVEGLEGSHAVNVAEARRGCNMLRRAGKHALSDKLAIDGDLESGWMTDGDGEVNEAVLELDHLYASVGVRVHSGYGGGMAVTQLRLWYATSLLNPDHFHNQSAYNVALFTEVSWRHFPTLSHDDYLEVQEGVILTHAMSFALHHPPLLVRAIKIAIDDWTPGAVPAIFNEIEVLAPLHLNPSLINAHSIERPALGYVWPLYNCSRWIAKEELQVENKEQPIIFLWFGDLEHNESVVRRDVRVNMSVVNCNIPEEALVEVYFGSKKLTSESKNQVVFTVSGLDPGLHIVTVKLRAVLSGEFLPVMDRRAFFVRREPPVHPFFLGRRVEVVGDGASRAMAGERCKFRIHVIEEEASLASKNRLDTACLSSWGRKMPWEANTREHWTVLLRGPALIAGQVVAAEMPGVYDVSYTAIDPGWYACLLCL